MKISEAAKLMDVTPVTLRYYERKGLIPPVTRKNGGVRDFHQEDLNWIEYIKCMRSAGLSVESLIEYTRLFQIGNETLEKRKQILVEERDALVAKYEELGSTIKKLNGKIADYDNGKFERCKKDLPEWAQKNLE